MSGEKKYSGWVEGMNQDAQDEIMAAMYKAKTAGEDPQLAALRTKRKIQIRAWLRGGMIEIFTLWVRSPQFQEKSIEEKSKFLSESIDVLERQIMEEVEAVVKEAGDVLRKRVEALIQQMWEH